MRVPRIIKISEDSTAGPASTEGKLSVCLSVCFSFPFRHPCFSFLARISSKKTASVKICSRSCDYFCGNTVMWSSCYFSGHRVVFLAKNKKMMKSAPPRALIMDSIEQSGYSRKSPNEYAVLPQSCGVCLVTEYA